MVMHRFDSAPVDDLPALVQYVLKNATATTAREVSYSLHCKSSELLAKYQITQIFLPLQVAESIREKLHFVDSNDPRYTGADLQPLIRAGNLEFEKYSCLTLSGAVNSVANLFDRGKRQASNQSPFLQSLLAFKAGFQASPMACEAFFKELQSAKGRQTRSLLQTGPTCLACSHKMVLALADGRNTDFLLLLLLHTLGNPWQKAVESLLKKKFAAAAMDFQIVAKVIDGHQVRF